MSWFESVHQKICPLEHQIVKHRWLLQQKSMQSNLHCFIMNKMRRGKCLGVVWGVVLAGNICFFAGALWVCCCFAGQSLALQERTTLGIVLGCWQALHAVTGFSLQSVSKSTMGYWCGTGNYSTKERRYVSFHRMHPLRYGHVGFGHYVQCRGAV